MIEGFSSALYPRTISRVGSEKSPLLILDHFFEKAKINSSRKILWSRTIIYKLGLSLGPHKIPNLVSRKTKKHTNTTNNPTLATQPIIVKSDSHLYGIKRKRKKILPKL